MDPQQFLVRCHCGNVQGWLTLPRQEIRAWDCNCSDCSMRGNVHIIVPRSDLTILNPQTTTSNQTPSSINTTLPPYQEATTLYLWGTHVAQRRFCNTCGILPWYIPRSNPDSYAITIHCIRRHDSNQQQQEEEAPKIVIEKFDGQHWEDFMDKLKQETHK